MLRRDLFLVLLATLAAAGCTVPRDADFTPSAAASTGPPPDLVPTGRFTEAFQTVGGTTEELQAGAEDLAARAAGLQARATALSAPVMDPADRDRLDAASAAAAPQEAP